jgi:2-iminobutanoate/2-iminopropanoate deaminase
MARRVVASTEAPQAIGPYSQAVRTGGLLYCSGQLPLNTEGQGEMAEDLSAQTRQCLSNLAAICRAAGTALDDAVRLTIYTTRIDRFSEINEAYAEFFSDQPPARVTVGVAALPRGAQVEIDAIVIAPDDKVSGRR